jgi:hypothetical protein
MPAANVGTRWTSGKLVFYDKATKTTIAEIDGTNLSFDVVAGAAFKVGGQAVTLGSFFDVTVATAAIKADNSVSNIVVPAITGKQFYPIFAAMQAAGSAGGATTIRLVESTAAGVVLSHVVADMTSTTWVGPTGGTVVTTLLNTALTISQGIKIVDVAANSLTTTTAVRCIVAGYYI